MTSVMLKQQNNKSNELVCLNYVFWKKLAITGNLYLVTVTLVWKLIFVTKLMSSGLFLPSVTLR